MSRSPFVMPVLAWTILGGCASYDDVKPTLSTADEISTTVAFGPTCKGTATFQNGLVAHAVGKPVAVTVKSETVTSSCRCAYTTTPQWSCSRDKECESEYDVGGPNPDVCERVDAVPAALPEVKASVDRPDCTAVVTVKDSSESVVTVMCTSAGPATVAVTVAWKPGAASYLAMIFTEDGACPPSEVPEAGSADAGPADSDAGANADATDADPTDAGASTDAAPE